MLLNSPVIVVTFKYVTVNLHSLLEPHANDLSFRIGLFGFAAGPMLREDNKIMGDEGVGNYGTCLLPRRSSFLMSYRPS
jgi:hypothetical protein